MYSLNGKVTAELLDRVSIFENSIVKEIAPRKIRRGKWRYVIVQTEEITCPYLKDRNNSRFICMCLTSFGCQFRVFFAVYLSRPSILLIIVFTVK